MELICIRVICNTQCVFIATCVPLQICDFLESQEIINITLVVERNFHFVLCLYIGFLARYVYFAFFKVNKDLWVFVGL